MLEVDAEVNLKERPLKSGIKSQSQKQPIKIGVKPLKMGVKSQPPAASRRQGQP